MENKSSIKDWIYIGFVVVVALLLSFLCIHFFFESFEGKFGFSGALVASVACTFLLDVGMWVWKSQVGKKNSTEEQEWIAMGMALINMGLTLACSSFHLWRLLKLSETPQWAGAIVSILVVIALIINVSMIFAYNLHSPQFIENKQLRKEAREFIGIYTNSRGKKSLEIAKVSGERAGERAGENHIGELEEQVNNRLNCKIPTEPSTTGNFQTPPPKS